MSNSASKVFVGFGSWELHVRPNGTGYWINDAPEPGQSRLTADEVQAAIRDHNLTERDS